MTKICILFLNYNAFTSANTSAPNVFKEASKAYSQQYHSQIQTTLINKGASIILKRLLEVNKKNKEVS